MYRIILYILVIFMAAGCSGEGGKTDDQAAPPVTEEPAAGTGEHRIPQPIDSDVTIVFGLFGDEAASATELDVKPGEMFDVWAIATVEGDIRTAAAQYRMALPKGVTLFAEHKIDSLSLTLGMATGNFQITFPCKNPGLVPLMRYTLQSDPDFTGGEVVLLEGTPPSGQSFRGIVTCPDDGTPLKLPAETQPLVVIVE